SAKILPKPSRRIIICNSALAASASPHFTSRPPSCSLVIYPFSWHSMTQPISQPNSLTSTQARSICVLSQETSVGFVQPVAQPAPDQPSYSGSSTISPLCGPELSTCVWQ